MSSTANAQPEPLKPTLAFVGPSNPLLFLTDVRDETRAKVHVLLSNSGDVAAEAVRFRLFVDSGSARLSLGAKGAVLADTRERFTGRVEAHSLVPLQLTFEIPANSRPRAAALEASVDPSLGTTPVVVLLTVQRTIPKTMLWRPIVIGVALAFLLTCWAAGRSYKAWRARRVAEEEAARKAGPEPPQPESWQRAPVYTDAAWKFADSWATNITALGAVLGTVLGASGFLAEVLPGIPTGRFTGLSLLFGALAVSAPLVYIAMGHRTTIKKDDKDVPVTFGSIAGLLVSWFVTLTAVFGQLAALGELVPLSDASAREEVLYYLLLSAAAGAVSIYALRSVNWLVSVERPEVTKPREAVGGGPGGIGVPATAAL